jgi:hypothetical protein
MEGQDELAKATLVVHVAKKHLLVFITYSNIHVTRS